jgi:hypothetical protein
VADDAVRRLAGVVGVVDGQLVVEHVLVLRTCRFSVTHGNANSRHISFSFGFCKSSGLWKHQQTSKLSDSGKKHEQINKQSKNDDVLIQQKRPALFKCAPLGSTLKHIKE